MRFQKDDKWHLFCVNRESGTGVMKVFIDGRNPYASSSYNVYEEGRVPEAEGTMHLGGFGQDNFPGKISGVNIWDRLLTDTEIFKMAKSCGDVAGNLKDWYDIKSELTLSKYTVITPSHCRSNI